MKVYPQLFQMYDTFGTTVACGKHSGSIQSSLVLNHLNVAWMFGTGHNVPRCFRGDQFTSSHRLLSKCHLLNALSSSNQLIVLHCF